MVAALLFKILMAVVLFGILIIVHEGGHFIMAKLMGVNVDIFSFGFGPRLFTLKRRETEYRISLFFFLGGFVKLFGDAKDDEIPPELENRSYLRKPFWRRMVIVLGGPFFNIVLAYLIATGFAFGGIRTMKTTVSSVLPGSPAMKAGLQPGDVIVAINGTFINRPEDDVPTLISTSTGSVTLRVRRAGVARDYSVTPEIKEVDGVRGKEQRRMIGIALAAALDRIPIPWWKAPSAGFDQTVSWTRITVVMLYRLFAGRIPLRDSVGGPIMIASLAGTVAEQAGVAGFLYLIAIISIGLAVVNLLPFPVLDGGHIVIFAIEGVRGKPINEKIIEAAMNFGMVTLIALFLFVSYLDTTNLIAKHNYEKTHPESVLSPQAHPPAKNGGK